MSTVLSPAPVPSLSLRRKTLPEDVRAKINGALQTTLTNLIDLSLQTKQAHWCLTGPRFLPVHEQLDELHAFYLSAIDDVAERMTALNGVPDGRAATVASNSGLPTFPQGAMTVEGVLSTMANHIAKTISRLREHQVEIGERDAITEDLLIGIIGTMEKQLWMVQAQES
ncbi:MAG: DNA starvation/stationary phase protection protein [Candidatus Hydrogenedentes bacterium]|nr:DNA starvation/stationary phase protection protein [Candidatus Hydrogenedentota bacterium]